MASKPLHAQTHNILTYKQFVGIPFVAKEYEYWFLGCVSVKKAVLIASLDLLSSQPGSGSLANSIPYEEFITIDLEGIEGGDAYLNSDNWDLPKIIKIIKENGTKKTDINSLDEQKIDVCYIGAGDNLQIVTPKIYLDKIRAELHQRKKLSEYEFLYYPNRSYGSNSETIHVKDGTVTFEKPIKAARIFECERGYSHCVGVDQGYPVMDGACDCLPCRVELEECYPSFLYPSAGNYGVKMKIEQESVYAFKGSFPPVTYKTSGSSCYLRLDSFEGNSVEVEKISGEYYSKIDSFIRPGL